MTSGTKSTLDSIYRGQWHEIFPHQTEYKDTDTLLEQSENFNFLLTKNDYNTRIFMRTQSITGNRFDSKTLTDQEAFATLNQSAIFKYNYEVYSHDLYPQIDEVKRDILYQIFSSKRIQNLTVLVCAKKITEYLPLSVKLERIRKSEFAKAEGTRKLIFEKKNAAPLYNVKIFISTNNPENRIHLKKALRSDHYFFVIKPVKKNRVIRFLNRKLNGGGEMRTSIFGWLINFFNIGNLVLDTIMNSVELTNYVILPQNPLEYSILTGERQTVQSGFVTEEESD